MHRRDYDAKEPYTGGTDTHLAVDTQMRQVIDNASTAGDREAFEEGFAAASGIRPETAETGGRLHAPERKDASIVESIPQTLEEENAGLADA